MFHFFIKYVPLTLSCDVHLPAPAAAHWYLPSSVRIITSLNIKSFLLLAQLRRSRFTNEVKKLELPSIL